MFLTMVEATVASERESDLRAAWAAETAGALPSGLVESWLVRGEGGSWRVVTVWESRDAVLAMRSAGRPAAVVMFEAAGAEPSVSMWTVEGRTASRQTGGS